MRNFTNVLGPVFVCGMFVGGCAKVPAPQVEVASTDAATASAVVAPTKVTPVANQELADMPGKEATTLTVEYAPGASSESHRHNAHVFVYVLEGSVVMGVAGNDPVTLSQGQTFYENPTDIHSVSKNASNTESAKILVVMLKDIGVAPVLPVN
jgi:quercetin dioxygenase-like cupin family protein